VTEMVTGVDLVEWQLRVAAGEPLPLRQEELSLSGHAFEARIYAERPEAGFLPGSGTLHHLRTPVEYGHTYVDAETRSVTAGHAVRLDTGVVEGDEISVFYDPMIAKLIVRGADRPSALQVLRKALSEWQTVGVPTNVPFLRRVLDTSAFADAAVHTAFIQQHEEVLLPKTPPTPTPRFLHLAALGWAAEQAQALVSLLPSASAWSAQPFLRLNGGVCGGGGLSPLRLQPLDFDGIPFGESQLLSMRRLPANGEGSVVSFEMALTPEATDGGAAQPPLATTDSSPARVELVEWDSEERRFRAMVDGASVSGSMVFTPHGEEHGVAMQLFAGGESVSILVSDVAQQAQARLSTSASATSAVAASVLAPMPGKIVRVLVSPGQTVSAGEALVVLEAMKMEHTMKALADGTVEGIHASEGDVVGQKALLLSFADSGPKETAAAAA